MKKYNYTLTVFVGGVDQSLELSAKSYDSSAFLIDHSNYKSFLISSLTKNTTIYTSLGDLPKNLEVAYRIMMFADRIIYSPPKNWLDCWLIDLENPGKSDKELTEILLMLLPNSIQVENLITEFPNPIPVVDSRKSQGPQMWSVGCSITHGVGVEPHQRYGQLLADELKLPCSFLTRPASAIDWAADQILRADICKGDLVVWGITNPERLTYVHNNKLLHGVNTYSYVKHPEFNDIVSLDNLYSQNTLYKHLYSIKQVINYCYKCDINLILTQVLFGNYSLLRFLKTQKNYAHQTCCLSFDNSLIAQKFIDTGTDNWHPGTKQHHQYKTTILDKIKTLEIL